MLAAQIQTQNTIPRTQIRAEDFGIADLPLTTLGLELAEQPHNHLQRHLQLAAEVEPIVVSPVLRTFQTAQSNSRWLIHKKYYFC